MQYTPPTTVETEIKRDRYDYHREYYKKNRDAIFTRHKQWCADNPEKHKANGIRGYLKSISTPEGKARCIERTSGRYSTEGELITW